MRHPSGGCFLIVALVHALVTSGHAAAAAAARDGAPAGLPGWVPPALVGLVGVAVLLLVWNRSLERRVRAHTRHLRASEQRFRAVFEAAGDAIFLMHDERFVECNRRTLELFRCAREDIVGRRPEEFSPPTQPDGRPSSEAAHERMVQARSGGPVVFEWRHLRRDGTPFDAEVTLNALELDGKVHLQAHVRDITRRKQLEADLRQAQKMEAIGTLAGGIAHDFNNILSAIMGYNELAREDVPAESDVGGYLRHMGRAAERARDLVQQILTFSRSTGESKRVMDLAPVLAESLALLRSSIPTSIEIRQRFTTPGRVLADPTGMRQIMLNLGTNAYHAMAGTGGVLDVRLVDHPARDDGAPRFVELSVSDTGAGMTPDVVHKIFEPYFTTKEADRGTGLGLAVVHGIVEDHGGAIDVQTAPGEGAVFRILLPACDEPPADPNGADEASAIRAAGGGERVLFVDDEPAIVDVFARGLERLGYRVTPCDDPRDAVAALEHDPAGFDVLVTDMAMPGLTGAALARTALAIAPGLPVLICTGFSDTLNLDAARALGARDLLMKPVDVGRLAHRIRLALANSSPS